MRLAEIIARPFEVLFTKQFVKDYASFVKARPSLTSTFEEFLRSKQDDWRRPFGQKDKAGTDLLRGWWHCHLVYGKVILSYDNNPSRIRCARITDHLSVEGTGIRIRGLATYLASLSDDDFVASKMPSAEKEVDARQVQIARDLFYEMAANREDRVILKAFADGSSDDAVEFFAVTEPPIEPSKVGGLDSLRAIAAEVLRTVPMNEGRVAESGDAYLYHSTSADLSSLRKHGLRSAEWEDEELDDLIGSGIHHLLFFTHAPQDEYGDVVLRFPTAALKLPDAYSPDRGAFFHARRPFAVPAAKLEVLEGEQWVPLTSRERSV